MNDPRAIGFALDLFSHAIGTARAFQLSDVAGSFAGMGEILNCILTIAPVALFLAVLTEHAA